MIPSTRVVLLALMLPGLVSAEPAEPDPETEFRLADLEARMAELEGATGRTENTAGPSFSLYGFTDFGFRASYYDDNSLLTSVDEPEGFMFTGVNIYFDFQLDPSWRALTEIRFTPLPNGTETIVPFARQSTEVSDRGTGLTSKLGSIIIERAHVDWTPSPLFGLRVGIFLTPYGIWSIDHGTPVLPSARAPYIVLLSPFPRQQLGLQVFGRVDAGPVELGYLVYVSNGEGIANEQVDIDEDKAIGWRATVSGRPTWGRYELGLSGFHGRTADTERYLRTKPTRFRTRETWAARDNAFGFDARLLTEVVDLYAEAIFSTREYERGKRPPSPFRDGDNPDQRVWGGYLYSAWHLPFDELDLRLVLGGDIGEAVHDPRYIPEGRVAAVVGGLNWRITPRVVAKAMFTQAFDITVDPHPDYRLYDFRYLDLQLAVAF